MNDRGDAQADRPLLFVGDIHLGQRSAVPGSVLPEAGIEVLDLVPVPPAHDVTSGSVGKRLDGAEPLLRRAR